MTTEEEISHLWGLALTKKQGWQYKDFPVVQDSTASLERAWPKAKKKKRLTNGDQVTVMMLELQWNAEARARQQDRQKGVFVPQPVGISAYLNQERWNNEIIISEKKIIEGEKCQCGEPVHGPQYNKCTTCMGYEGTKLITPCADELRAYYKSHPEIQGFGREQAVEFMKNKLRSITHKKI